MSLQHNVPKKNDECQIVLVLQDLVVSITHILLYHEGAWPSSSSIKASRYELSYIIQNPVSHPLPPMQAGIRVRDHQPSFQVLAEQLPMQT
jgi:hypothetical protein